MFLFISIKNARIADRVQSCGRDAGGDAVARGRRYACDEGSAGLEVRLHLCSESLSARTRLRGEASQEPRLT